MPACFLLLLSSNCLPACHVDSSATWLFIRLFFVGPRHWATRIIRFCGCAVAALARPLRGHVYLRCFWGCCQWPLTTCMPQSNPATTGQLNTTSGKLSYTAPMTDSDKHH